MKKFINTNMKEVRGDGPRLEPKCFPPLSSEVNLG
jgi:hypothetical protein